jgi:hypothetical protein
VTPPIARRATAVLAATALAVLSVPTASEAATPVPPSTLSAPAITTRLNHDAAIAGTAWMTRPDGTVVVSYDDTVSGKKLTSLLAVTRQFGAKVVVEKSPGTLRKFISGGSAAYGQAGRCSAAFNVQAGGKYYFLTAGHCGNIIQTWYSDQALRTKIGSTQHSSFPNNDFSLVKYTTTGKPPGGSVNLYNGKSQDIRTAGTAKLNQAVARAGSTSGLHSGRVTGLNATVNYAEGQVSGLIKTNVCAESGDSGGPLFAGTVALGITSGGSGDCTSGGTTYFQPVTEPLSVYKVSVY